tara:strand:- start:70 stop:594 length:525 start_codon:yes stop_codon:yes gene_type:complete
MYSVNEVFPTFEMDAVQRDPNGQDSFLKVSDAGLEGKWSVVYFYPKDFTFICPTEIQAMDSLVDEDVNVLGISGDNEFCKAAWKQENDLIKDIQHPLAADCGLYLASELGVLDVENGVAFRATFILDPDMVIQHASCNALDTGRNADEVKRTLEALRAGGLTGCSWNPGEEFVA